MGDEVTSETSKNVWRGGFIPAFVLVVITGVMGMAKHTWASEPGGYKVVELFTSQSCSSCPPADRVLESFSGKEHIITLGYHVTYWDHLSWKDRLSLPAATELQRTLNAERGSNRIYTPQMVINGVEELVGSDGGRAVSLLNNAPTLARISLEHTGGMLTITLSAGYAGKISSEASVMLVAVGKAHRQSIEDGENAGRNVFYTSPVAFLRYLPPGDMTASGTLQVPIENLSSLEEVVVLVREGRAGKILAAGRVRV